MNVSFEKIDNVNGELTVTLVEQDYADKVKKQLKDLGKTQAMPGFRPGHVPAAMLEKKYGNSVRYEVVNREIADAVYDYLKEKDLKVLGQPVPDKNNVFKNEDREFTFKFKVGLAPEIDNHVDKNLHVPFYTAEVSEEMLNNQIDSLRERYGRQVPGDVTEPNAVIKGEITELNEDGTPKEGGVFVENGIIAPIHFTDDEQKKLFEDKHPGDVVKFNPAATCNANPTEMSSMLNIDKDDVDNHKGDFDFKIKEIIVLRPAELDQEFFDMALGKDRAHNEEEFRKAVKEMLAASLLNDSNYRFSIDARDKVLEAVGEVELPDEVLKEYLMRQSDKINENNVEEEYANVRKQLIWDLVRDSILTKFEVKVNDDDLLEEARGVVARQLSQYGQGALSSELLDRYAQDMLKDEKSRDYLIQNAINRKTFETVKEHVTLDGKTVTLEEFRKLFLPKED